MSASHLFGRRLQKTLGGEWEVRQGRVSHQASSHCGQRELSSSGDLGETFRRGTLITQIDLRRLLIEGWPPSLLHASRVGSGAGGSQETQMAAVGRQTCVH